MPVTILLGAQAEIASECPLLSIFTRLIGNNLPGIADLLAVLVHKIHQILRRFAVATYGFLLIEVQREDHVVDLPTSRQQADSHRLGVDLIPVALVHFVGIA